MVSQPTSCQDNKLAHSIPICRRFNISRGCKSNASASGRFKIMLTAPLREAPASRTFLRLH